MVIESLLKMMKNAFYLISKALFVLKTCLVIWENGLEGKQMLISNFVMSQAGKQMITIHILLHILPNISRSKSNQKLKFGQLIEYEVSIIFLQKSCRKRGRGSSSRPLVF